MKKKLVKVLDKRYILCYTKGTKEMDIPISTPPVVSPRTNTKAWRQLGETAKLENLKHLGGFTMISNALMYAVLFSIMFILFAPFDTWANRV